MRRAARDGESLGESFFTLSGLAMLSLLLDGFGCVAKLPFESRVFIPFQISRQLLQSRSSSGSQSPDNRRKGAALCFRAIRTGQDERFDHHVQIANAPERIGKMFQSCPQPLAVFA